MPDDHSAGPGPRDDAGPPRARRRRSADTYGGIRVSDLLEQHTGIRPKFDTNAAATEAPRAHGRRARDPHPSLPPAARRPAPPAPPAESRAPAPPAQRRPPVPPAARPPRRPVPPPPAPRPPLPEPPKAAPVPPKADSPLRRRLEGEPDQQAVPPQPPRPPRPGGPPRPPRPPRPRTVSAEDRLTMTDELEPIDDSTKVRRKIDHSLARFSAAHDELAAEEAKRKQRMDRFAARPAQLLEQTRTRLQRVVAPTKTDEPTRVVSEPPAGSSLPQTRLQEKKQRRTERSILAGRITAAVLAVLIFLGIGAAWGAKTWFNSKFTEIAALDENSTDIMDAPAQNGDENFLIVGSDTRAGATADENVGSADNIEGARSDTVMLAHVPADRQRAVVISFPRDLEISRPACQRFDVAENDYTDEVVSAATKVKLNTAYAVGGPRCLTKWVQQLTGLRINHFVGIDFSGFKDMVDAVQGVTVKIDKPITDSVLGKVISQTGDVTITGDQALSFVRARHVIGDLTSDYGRIKRQQEFISALMTKVMSRGVITDPAQLTGFVTAFARATFGDNIGVDQMLTLAQSMKGLDPSKVNFITVPTTGEANTRGNEVLLDTKAKAIFQALIDNAPLPGSTPASQSAGAQASAGTGAAGSRPDQ